MTNTKVLLEEAQFYSEAIKMVMIKEYQSVLDEHELTSKQLLILQHIFIKNQLTINEVSSIISATKSAASQFIKKLEEKGYVKREVNPENRRETFVRLEKKGEDLYREMEAANQRVIEKYYQKLSIVDIESYHRVLKKLYELTQTGWGE
ncbi:MarR family winged helix-turn-helix transcriptional regulator [Ammoniphilus sp. CFH 90114]|uniref:MarR family winged helix-turn-helix transcriptional regulator n=1 Tax=Ammoniphilus sp. CFH 90114 TaxID=2493665 RepID=UPI00100E5BA4|nr:MarR family transcriptional regulator [Ammoniphilus sp. CFH 90114]RXT02818.1 MarR family transcriptional regulator [Ammoniphilus sp. CFH 90114]